jgi:hypothetical protein
MFCSDCGETSCERSRRRSDLCTNCVDLRTQFMEHAKTMDLDEFREVQRVVRRNDGTAADAMRRVMQPINERSKQ